MHFGMQLSDPSCIIEDAFTKLLATKAIHDVIRQALKDGIAVVVKVAVKAKACSKSCADADLAAEAARDLAVQVDDFPVDQFWLFAVEG